MGTPTLHTPSASILNRFPAFLNRLDSTLANRPTAPAAAAPLTLSPGDNLEKAGACFAAQIGEQAPLPLGTLSRGEGLAQVQGVRALGATEFTVAPEVLTGRRKTNQTILGAAAHGATAQSTSF